MSNWFDSDIAVLAVSIILSGILLPQILRVAYKRQLFDDNEARKIHSGHIPRLGGLSFFPASLFAFCLLIAVNLSVGEASFSENLSQHALALTYFACSVALMYIMGMVDDIVGLNFRVKLVIQILSAVLVVMSGTLIFNLDGLLWIWELPTWIAWFLSGFYVVLMVNAINFIDGLDGLATGLCVIALVFYAVILYMGGAFLYSMIACATIGPLLVFFYYNVFGTIERKKKVDRCPDHNVAEQGVGDANIRREDDVACQEEDRSGKYDCQHDALLVAALEQLMMNVYVVRMEGVHMALHSVEVNPDKVKNRNQNRRIGQHEGVDFGIFTAHRPGQFADRQT